MIIYFADRHLNILGQASTHLPEGIRITDDLKTEDVDTGVAIFECDIHFDRKTRAKVEEWAEVGNYILRSADDEAEFYNIIDAKINTKKQTAYIYAEDDGLDLLNDVAEAYAADQYYPISTYVERFASGAGFEIGINEVEGLTRKLSWDSEQTASARLLSIAEAFNNCEISFSFEINGLQISKKYINIYEERGKDTGIQLRLNKEIDSIVTTKSIANLATALKAKGGTPDNSEEPITLLGYEYDDGDFYVDGAVLKSRKALERWSRYLWKDDDSQQLGGHIVKSFSYDTTSQAVLCEKTIEELKKVCDMEINYEADITKFPETVKVGDRVNIVDDAGSLYLSSRVLILETSETDKTRRAVLGEHLIRKSGISAKVEQLAAEFAKVTVSVTRAKAIADNAKVLAAQAQTQAESALKEAEAAQVVADVAKTASDTATQSAANAQAQAQAAQAAVDKVEESVSSLETTVQNAQNAADNAHQAAATATEKADEAKTAAENAVKDASEAKTEAGNAQTAAENAVSKAETATATANTAKTTAETASNTAQAAKLDAEQAEKDVAAFGESLETFRQTVSADYTRKTELTETTANLQAQITANANQLQITHSKVVEVDETANNAADLAAQAQSEAAAAQSQADTATADAQAAQTAADEAKAAAQAAQSEADTAKTAAATAQSVADKAEEDLEKAKADLATVQGRVDATEEEIAAAQQAVSTAQAAADKAKTDAATATSKAEAAQTTANTAVTNAANAQTAANNAASQAAIAQTAANEAKGNASTAQQAANEAAQAAATAQATADTAVANAAAAQTKANEVATAAANAQKAADDADTKAQQAKTDLATAQQNLIDVTSRVGATEEEVEAAQAAVEIAQAAADTAQAEAEAAQATADKAKADAATAQTAANNAKTAADNAQAAADAAQAAADKAQEDVNALEYRVTTAETEIIKNAEEIALRAKKTEVVQYINNIDIGGRNLLTNSDIEVTKEAGTTQAEFIQYADLAPIFDKYGLIQYTLSFDIKSADITNSDSVNVYCQNGSTTKHSIGYSAITVTTEYVRHSITFIPSIQDETATQSLLAFYGTYNTGNIPSVKNVKLEKGNKATDWTPAPEDMTSKDEFVDTLDGYYTKEATEAAISVKSDEITSSVNKTVEELQATDEATAERVTASESAIKQLSDSISMLVTDGNGASLMTQTENGWTFCTAEIEDAVKKASESLDTVAKDLGSTDAAVEVLQQAVKDIEAKTDYVKISTYTYTDESGTQKTEPCIELGETDSEYKLLITNSQILFKVGSNTPTRIDTEGLITENITVEKELRQTNENVSGYFVWAMRSNGNYGLSWKEGES